MTTDPVPPKPAAYETRTGPGGELEYFTGTAWVRYEDPPTPVTGHDRGPLWVQKGTEDDEDANDDGIAIDNDSR